MILYRDIINILYIMVALVVSFRRFQETTKDIQDNY